MGEPLSDFTPAEIFNALRLVMPKGEARRLADSVSKPIDGEAIPSQPLQNRAGPGLPYRSIPKTEAWRHRRKALAAWRNAGCPGPMEVDDVSGAPRSDQ